MNLRPSTLAELLNRLDALVSRHGGHWSAECKVLGQDEAWPAAWEAEVFVIRWPHVEGVAVTTASRSFWIGECESPDIAIGIAARAAIAEAETWTDADTPPPGVFLDRSRDDA